MATPINDADIDAILNDIGMVYGSNGQPVDLFYRHRQDIKTLVREYSATYPKFNFKPSPEDLESQNDFTVVGTLQQFWLGSDIAPPGIAPVGMGAFNNIFPKISGLSISVRATPGQEHWAALCGVLFDIPSSYTVNRLWIANYAGKTRGQYTPALKMVASGIRWVDFKNTLGLKENATIQVRAEFTNQSGEAATAGVGDTPLIIPTAVAVHFMPYSLLTSVVLSGMYTVV